MTQQPAPAPPDKPDEPTEAAGPSTQAAGPTTEAAGPTTQAGEPSRPEQAPAPAVQTDEELPDQPSTAMPPPPPPPVPAAPPKKKRRVWPYVVAGVVVLFGLLVTLGVFMVRDALRVEVPQVGDCLNNAANPDDMEVVDCAAAEAAWSVIGNDGSWSRGDFDAATEGEVCQEFPDTQQALWVTGSPSVNSGTEGEVICLAPVA